MLIYCWTQLAFFDDRGNTLSRTRVDGGSLKKFCHIRQMLRTDLVTCVL